MSATQAELLAVQVGTPTAYAFSLAAQEDANGTVLDISWNGIPNRDPSTSGDFVAIWQNDGSVPFGSTVQATQQVTNKTPDGDIPFSGLQLANLPYVAAYSVGTDATNFHNLAAVIPVGVGGIPGQVQATTLNVAFVGATSLTLDYTTPIGTDPKAFGHSVVLVAGETYIPGTSSPIATTKPSDNQNDAASFVGVTMTVGQWYTGAYLTGSTPSTVAATVTFQVAKG